MNDIFYTIPENGSNDEYAIAVRKLNEYFKPQVNTKYEMLNFYKCEQRAYETIDAMALLNRSTRATLPEIKTSLFCKTMRETDDTAKFQMKQYADRRTNAKPSNLQPRDTVLEKLRRVNKNSTPYKPITYEVVARKRTMSTAKNVNYHKQYLKIQPLEIKMELSVLSTEDDSLEENLSSSDMSTDMSLESTTLSHVDSPRYPPRSSGNQKPVWLKDYE